LVDFGRDILGWASTLEAGVDREGLVAARSAEGVSFVPIEKMSRFRVDGRYGVSDIRIQRRTGMNQR
jgi:hypothetical protein